MMRLTQLGSFLVIASGCLSMWVGSAEAVVVIVEDTWNDGTRTDPPGAGDPTPSPDNYSEFGFDWDDDLDIESAWFIGGSDGTLDPVGAGGPLRLTQGSNSSSSLTTYFTDEGKELTLDQEGDSIKLTWQFEVSGTIASNNSQGLRMALVDSPAASRISNNSSPGSAAYTGYALFANMDTILNRSDPFELMKRTDGNGALLSSSSEWTALADNGTDEADGYDPGNLYTFTMMLTRAAGGAIDIYTSMAGGNIDNDGLLEIAYTDATPSPLGGYTFDTFEFRPDGMDVSYSVIDTHLFKVEYTQLVPEPLSVVLLLSGLGIFFAARRGRKP